MPASLEFVLPAARVCLGYADLVIGDIPDGDFGRMVRTANSPAWCIGHLGIYPDRILSMIGRADLAAPIEAHAALFAAGVECRDDPDGTIYPAKEVLVARLRTRHDVALEALEGASGEALRAENPIERIRDRFPSVGHLVTFLLTGHMMMHLGQISTWRRCMGLGPCM